MNKIILDNKLFYYQVFYKKNKNMYLRIKNDIITITAPKSFSLEAIESFIIKHKTFIFKHQRRINRKLYSNEYFELSGIKYNRINYEGRKFKVEGFEVFVPEKADNKRIENFYKTYTKNQAKEIIDCELNNKMIDIDFSNLIIKSRLMKSRLGSCNKTKKIINLNSILGRLDIKYLKAVLIHELTHLKIANHQKDFYDLLLKYEVNYRKIHKELNEIIKEYEI